MGLIAWIILGLLAGAIARLIVPGRQPGGCIATIIFGIIGAVLGGYIGSVLTGVGITGVDIRSILLAIIGSIIFIYLWAAIFGRR